MKYKDYLPPPPPPPKPPPLDPLPPLPDLLLGGVPAVDKVEEMLSKVVIKLPEEKVNPLWEVTLFISSAEIIRSKA